MPASTRTASIERRTGETSIELTLNIDGSGMVDSATGIGFLDHMLHLFARHGLFDLKVHASGDLHVDEHHTAEDVCICLGQALDRALGERRGLVRIAHRRDLVKIGFAAETHDLLTYAREKLERKGLDMIVANEAVASIGAGDIQMILIDAQGVERLPQLPKPVAAERLLDAIIERFAARLRAPEIGSMTTEE